MNSSSHVDTGVRKVLERPSVYNFFQDIIGANKHRAAHFMKYFSNSKGKKILDIGCGTAILINYIDEDAEYHGCDMQASYIEFCNNNYADRGHFYCEKVGDKIREEWFSYFDVINAHGLLHHLNEEQSEKLLSISEKYLKKGGKLVTLDTLYHEDQSALSKWLVSKDRGQNIRTPEEYLTLANNFFDKVDGYIDDKPFYIPYSVYIMVMEK